MAGFNLSTKNTVIIVFPPAQKKGMVKFPKKGTFSARRHAKRALSRARRHVKRAFSMML